MGYKNMRELLVAGTQLPAAIEGALPAGAPKISTMLVDAANMIPIGPGFPIEIPDLPALPKFAPPGNGLPGLGRYVREVEITPERAASPAAARRGRIRFLY